ncbi:hypothetical protein HYH02_008847 [Chlamydomonas schloesseri]|uniref:Uncharacterized protein n=1 Tax=Chlamydomonas schloesseri TaxID=2026947 RepID=A0A835WCP7_9CHLO|nr:hypothetical protein HYH02_008847 [Chlamydomonas schloesseri]|eukprot:KAG2444977.1 hypothetical protein HYH02_008847 [Chlamydomonas schloesseri]
MARAKESREVARRVDQIVKAGVSEFEDDSKPAGPLPVAQMPALPPPPMTPPTGASKPAYQAGAPLSYNAEEEAADTSYFPEQVSLNIGGGGGGFGRPAAAPAAMFGAPPAQSSSLRSFQPMDSQAPLAQAPAPQPAMLPALGAQTQMRQQQQQQTYHQQQLYQQQQHYQQPQTLPSLQHQQPELAYEPQEAAAAPPPPPPPAPTDDIWSSLQSAYRIKDPPAGPASAHSKGSSGRGAGKGAPSGEVLVLGDDDPFSGGKGMVAPNLNGTMNRTSGFGGRGGQAGNTAQPSRPAAAAKSGGWGAGNMARAGELMIGAADDDWLEGGDARQQLPPAGGFGGRGAVSQRSDEYGGGYNQQPAAGLNKAPLAQGRHADDILCEDVEDVDMLLEDEMQGIADKNLANKLAAFDAQFNDDD